MKALKIFIVLFLLSSSVYAQFRQDGQMSISLEAGASTKGHSVRLSGQKIIKNTNSSIRFDSNYNYAKRNVRGLNDSIESNIINFGLAYSYTIYDVFGDILLPHFYLGGFMGYEDNKVKNKHLVKTKDGMGYGTYGGMELEFNISNSISLVTDFSYYYNLKSSLNKNLTQALVGVKFYLN